jgi:arginyl-tRNA synthetase
MKIKLESELIEAFPSLRYTAVLVKDLNNERKISSLSQLLRGTSAVLKNDLKKVERKDYFTRITEPMAPEGVTFLESYTLSSLVKKILAGKEIEGKDNLTNLIRFLSLKFYLPLFGFDLDQADRDYPIEFYSPKKGKKAPELDFTARTRNLVIWFPNLGDWNDENIDHFINEIGLNLNKYLQAGIAEVFHLDAEHREADLGYVSELEKARAEAGETEEEAVPSEPATIISPDSSIIPPAGFTAWPEEEGLPAQKLKIALARTVSQLFPELSSLEQLSEISDLVEVEIPKDASHGDLSTNLAMKLAKMVNQPPQQIAEKILAALPEQLEAETGLLEKTEMLGPGFINFHLHPDYFRKQLNRLLEEKEGFGRQNIGRGEKIMIEWGSLNIAKPFGVHHFMTTIIGNTLVNLYRVIGYQVLSADFPGDWGTQFGKSLYAYKNWGDKAVVEKDPVNELLKLYVRFHDEAEKNPELEQAARDEFKKLEQGDGENLKLWKWIVEVSTRDLYSIYQTLGVKHDRTYPESKYNEACQRILEKGKQLGIITEGEKGAYIVNLEAENLPPALVQKGDGTTLYTTRDLASIEDRLTGEPDLKRLVYVVDIAQSLNFRQLFAIAHRFHQADPSFPVTEFKHIPFGRMSFADGSMSTRKGKIIQGREIIREAHDRAEKIVQQKLLENGSTLSPGETAKLVHGLAIGAIKYAMVTQAPESDLVFDWDKVISFEGNSAPYLQYSLARAYSILRKSIEKEQPATTEDTTKPAKSVSEDQTSLFSLPQEQLTTQKAQELAAAEAGQTPFGQPSEQALLRQLVQFPQKVAAAAQLYKPNLLTTYLHDLSQTFNTFYGAVPVLKSSRPELREARLQLVRATAQILKNGLQILGIATFERM